MTDPVLSKRLSNVKNAVIPGFYGSANDGSKTIKTFSRGGSVLTAVIVANNVHVHLFEIFFSRFVLVIFFCCIFFFIIFLLFHSVL